MYAAAFLPRRGGEFCSLAPIKLKMGREVQSLWLFSLLLGEDFIIR